MTEVLLCTTYRKSQDILRRELAAIPAVINRQPIIGHSPRFGRIEFDNEEVMDFEQSGNRIHRLFGAVEYERVAAIFRARDAMLAKIEPALKRAAENRKAKERGQEQML